jgi:hypothetical protein
MDGSAMAARRAISWPVVCLGRCRALRTRCSASSMSAATSITSFKSRPKTTGRPVTTANFAPSPMRAQKVRVPVLQTHATMGIYARRTPAIPRQPNACNLKSFVRTTMPAPRTHVTQNSDVSTQTYNAHQAVPVSTGNVSKRLVNASRSFPPVVVTTEIRVPFSIYAPAPSAPVKMPRTAYRAVTICQTVHLCSASAGSAVPASCCRCSAVVPCGSLTQKTAYSHAGLTR